MLHRLAALMLCVLVVTGCSPAPAPAPETSGNASPDPTPSSSTPDLPPASATSEPVRSLVLATDAGGNSISVIDPADRSAPVQGRIEVGAAPWDVAVHGEQAFVSTAEGVAVVDLREGRRTSLIAYAHPVQTVEYGEYRPGGTGIAVSPDGSTVFVAVVRAAGPAVLEKIDLATGKVAGSVDVGLRPFDILMSEDGAEVYTIDHDSFSVHIVDAGALSARRVEVAPFGTTGGLASWEKPHYAALDADGRLLMPYQGLVLAVLDPRSETVTVEEMTANSHQHGAALTADGGRLLSVGTGAFGNATGEPNLTIRDLPSGEEQIVELERLHETVIPWTDPSSGRELALLSGGHTRDGFWEGITVVDLETLEQRELVVPGRPQALAVK